MHVHICATYSWPQSGHANIKKLIQENLRYLYFVYIDLKENKTYISLFGILKSKKYY